MPLRKNLNNSRKMNTEELDRTITNAKKHYRKLLPLKIRDLELDKISMDNCVVHSLNRRDFEDFKDNWELFINSLDKFWNQLNAFAKHESAEKSVTLLGFLGNENKRRTTDDLLVFLDKARNSSQHTLWIHMRQSAPMEVLAGHGATITFLQNGVSVSGPGESAKELVILGKPGVFLLNDVKVIERKVEVVYPLPMKHHDYSFKALERALPQIIGKLGLAYYGGIYEEFKKRLDSKR